MRFKRPIKTGAIARFLHGIIVIIMVSTKIEKVPVFAGILDRNRISKRAEQTNSTDYDSVVPFIEKKDDIVKFQVPSISLKSILKKYKLSKIDLLKLDIQGGEYDVLKSSKDLLKNIDALLVEVSFIADDTVKLCSLLSNSFPASKVMGEVKMGADILFFR